MATLGILGCGEAFDSGYGNNSCLLYGKGVPTLLFDCGYQIPERLWAAEELYPTLEGIYLTHFHADHAFGVAPLLVRFLEERRKAPLTIFGPAGVDAYVRKAVELAYPGAYRKLPFKLEFKRLRDGDGWSWKGLHFDCAASVHSVKNLAVRVRAGKKGDRFCVSGDGRFTEATLALYRDSDILLHEAYYARRDNPSHTALVELFEHLRGGPTRHVVVTHHSRTDRDSIDVLIRRLARRDKRWSQAHPGKTFEIRVK